MTVKESLSFDNAQAAQLFRRALSYTAPLRKQFAIKFGLVALSMLPIIFLPWPIKIVIDHVIGDVAIGQEIHPYPFFIAPLIHLLADVSKAEILIAAVAMQFGMLLTFGAFGADLAERDAVLTQGGEGQDTASRSENQANAGMSLVGGLLGFFDYRFTMRLTQRLNHHYRKQLYDRVQRLPMTAFDDERIGDAVYRVMYDTPAITNICYSILISPFASPLNILLTVGVLSSVYGTHSPVVLFAVLFFPVVLMATLPLVVLVRRRGTASRQAGATTTATLEEGIGNMTAVQSLGGQGRERRRFDHDSSASFAAYRNLQALILLAWLFGGVMAGLLVAWVFIHIGDQIIAGLLSAGDVGVLIPYFISIAYSSTSLGNLWFRIQENATGMQRVFWLMDLPGEADAASTHSLPTIRESVRLEEVSFAYEAGRPVLEGISLEAKKGEMTALVGPAGAGKTTLAYMIPRFLTPSSGRVRIDGSDIAEVSLDSLRAQIAFVFQETTFFDTTIAENLKLGRKDADEDALIRATQAAGIYDFIAGLPQGFETRLGRAGGKLSVGQKQRLSIARALLCEAPVVIVDEPTSALDPETEGKLVAMLHALSRERIVIVIAHRLSTIKGAGQILFLEHGRIIERGSHQTLMERDGGAYRHFVDLQTPGLDSA